MIPPPLLVLEESEMEESEDFMDDVILARSALVEVFWKDPTKSPSRGTFILIDEQKIVFQEQFSEGWYFAFRFSGWKEVEDEDIY